MDKILDKIIRQVIVEATTRKRLTKQIDSDTILTKLIKQVITEADDKIKFEKFDKKTSAAVGSYGWGFTISANFLITNDQVRDVIRLNGQFGTNSTFNSYLNYTYFVGSNMRKRSKKGFAANVVIINAKTMKSFNSAMFNTEVKNLLEPDGSNADVVVSGYKADTVGRKDAALEAQHHKARGTEAVYNSTKPGENHNVGSNIIFIDKNPGYTRLPGSLMAVLTKTEEVIAPVADKKVDDKNLASKNSTATTYFNSGKEKFYGDDEAGSIKDFDEAIKLDPKYTAAYEHRGYAKTNLNDYTGAIKDFDEAIKLDPNNKYLYLGRAKAKDNETPGSGAEDSKTYDILNKGGNLPVVDKPAEQENIEASAKIIELDKAIKLDPKNAMAYYDRGIAKIELSDLKGSMLDFDEAIKLDPRLAKAYFIRGVLKGIDLKDYAGAIKDFDEVIKLGGGTAGVYNERGKNKNLLEPGSGDEDIKTAADMKSKESIKDIENKEPVKLDPIGSIKKQTFKYGDKDNSDLATLQELIQTQFKLSVEADSESIINTVPSFVAFMKVPKTQFGTYGTQTSNMIADLKKAYEYTNTNGKTIEPDFVQKLIDDQKWKLKLTEQFKFTDKQKQLLSTKPVDVNPVKKEPVKKEPVDIKQPTELTDFKFAKIPGGQNNYRSAQITANILPSVIKKYGIKNIIRMNGDGHDSKHKSTYPETSKSTEERICKENGCTYYYIDSHSGFKAGQGYTQSIQKTNDILNKGNTLIHCAHGADRTGAMVGAYLKNNGYMTDKDELWKYTTQFNGWQSRINSNTFFGSGFDRYADGFYPISDLRNSKWVNGNKSIKKGDTKKDEPLSGDRLDVALTKAYQLCLAAAKDLRKITTTNPHDYWSGYLRFNGVLYRPKGNEKGIAWFKSAWDKAWGTKLAAASKIRNTATQKNINELNRRKNDVIEMIRKGGSMTVYLRIQNPFTGAPTDFKIKWDYFAGIQNAAIKGNPKKTVTKKPSSSGAIYSNPGYGGNLGR